MAGVEARSFDSPDETRTPEKTTVEIVRMGGTSASRMSLQPGWRWSECVMPLVGGERCQMRHVGVLQSGTKHIVHDDVTEQEIGPGHAYVIEPGHDAWVVGDEPVVGFELESRTAEEYAKVRSSTSHSLRPVRSLSDRRRARRGGASLPELGHPPRPRRRHPPCMTSVRPPLAL